MQDPLAHIRKQLEQAREDVRLGLATRARQFNILTNELIRLAGSDQPLRTRMAALQLLTELGWGPGKE